MNERKRYSDLWEIFREPVRPGDPDYVDCEPDFRVSEITEITPQMLAQLGIRHALIDLDGTLVCPPSREINPETLAHLNRLFVGKPGIPLSIATENGGSQDELACIIGEGTRVFQPYRTPSGAMLHKPSPAFYRRILFELGLDDSPELVGMIGDSPVNDIEPAKKVGMKTIQVDRLTERPNRQNPARRKK